MCIIYFLTYKNMTPDNIDQWEKKKSPRERIKEIVDKELADLKMDIQKNNNSNVVQSAHNNPKKQIEKKDTYEVIGGGEIKGEKTKAEEKVEVNPEILKEEMRKDLKTVSSMSSEEIKAELKSYSVEITEKAEDNIIELRKLLNNARNTIAIEDKNSNIIDFHIGTYIQGESKYCTVLAQLDTMTDDEIKDMIQTEEDSDNKISYHVTFPNGDATVISEEELNSWTINKDWENIILNDLPKWDKDVKLITMAYVKTFWTHIVGNWEWQYKAQNKFRKPGEQLYDNQYFEDIKDYSNLPKYSTISVINSDELKRKGFEFKIQTEEEASWIKDRTTRSEATSNGWWATIITLSNDKKVCITATYMYISDWTLIPVGHAMTIRWYDEASEELIISGNEFNNISEIRIPKELFKVLETASPEWTPGVDKTPQPTE